MGGHLKHMIRCGYENNDVLMELARLADNALKYREEEWDKVKKAGGVADDQHKYRLAAWEIYQRRNIAYDECCKRLDAYRESVSNERRRIGETCPSG